MKIRLGDIAALFMMCLCAACSRVPDHVIPPEQMARLMADLRTADAVLTYNPQQYRADSSRRALKQAVFDRNGVTQAQFDTSLVWYGHNIGRYQDVTERSIEILQGRLADMSALAASAQVLSVAGDSVDVWPGSHSYVFTQRSPSDYLTFNLEADRNWERGDTYTWYVKFVTVPASARWNITAEYEDGAVETISTVITGSNPSRQMLAFMTDSTRTARSVSGWLHIEPDGHKPVYIDSVSLTRGRLSERVPARHYMQRMVEPRKSKSEPDVVTAADSAGVR